MSERPWPTTEEIRARIARVRQVLEEPPQVPLTLAYVAELRDHLRWLMDHDGVVRDLSAILEENRRLRGEK